MRATPISHLEWMRTGRLAPYVTAHALAGGAISMVEAAQPSGDMSDPATSDLILVRALTPIRQTSDFGEGCFRAASRPGAFFLIPPHRPSSIVVDDAHVIRCFALPYARCAKLFGAARPPNIGRLHLGDFHSPLLQALSDRLWEQGSEGHPAIRLYADGAILTILAELARLAGAPTTTPVVSTIDWRLRRAIDYLEARLAEDVGLADVARVVSLTPGHLATLFRNATGEPPHRWLMRRRFERACELLATSSHSVTEVAHRCGFASSQHLATVFRKCLGMTPSAYSCERRS